MRDWIKEYKSDIDRHRENEKQEEVKKQRILEVILAKGPEFWDRTVIEVKEQADEFYRACQSPSARTEFIPLSANSFRLKSLSVPSVTLSANPDTRMRRVKIHVATEVSNFYPKKPAHESVIAIGVDDNENVYCVFEDRTYLSPESLAGRLVRLVCGVPEKQAGASSGA